MFRKLVEDLKGYGVTVQEAEDNFIIYRNWNTRIASVSTKSMYAYSTNFKDFRNYEGEDKAIIADHIAMMSRVPLDERILGKKYVWKVKGIGNNITEVARYYFNYDKANNRWYFETKNHHEEVGLLTQFTSKEFKELKNKLGITLEFEKEEVKINE